MKSSIGKNVKEAIGRGEVRRRKDGGGNERVPENEKESVRKANTLRFDFDVDLAKFTDRQMEAVKLLDRQFIEGCKDPVIKFLLYGGALGGGKSYFLRWVLVRLLMNWFFLKGLKNVQVMLACEDFPSLKDRQLSKIGREFPVWLGKSYSDHKEYGRCFQLAPEYGFGIICFRNLDDASKYQSAEFAAIAVDELTKNDVETFTFLRMRLRWPGLKDQECVFIGATNPGGIGHSFCKAIWMDKNFPTEFVNPVDYRSMFAYVPSKAEDNPHLDAAYWQMLSTLPPHLVNAFKEGSWDVFVGQAFQEWSRIYHIMEPLRLEHTQSPLVPDGRPVYMTFDWGFGKPFSVCWFWLDDDNRKYLFAEWYGWNGTPDQGLRLTDSEIADGIIKREQAMGFTIMQKEHAFGSENMRSIVNPQIIRLCDPTCFNKKPDYRGGGQGPSTAEIFMNMGLNLRPGDPSRVLKWRQFHEHLRVPRDGEDKVVGVPMLQIYSTCLHFIRTVPALVTDPNNIEDIDSSGEDHCADSAAHMFMARPVKQIAPIEEKRKQPTIEDIARLEHKQIFQEIQEQEYEEIFGW
jgi:phage terminase large subunit